MVDRLTKFAHFIALPTSFSAKSLASVFISEIYRLHGAPKTIVSDRDRVFISQFWRELFKALGTSLAFSSSYHPQTDGQTEVLNRCLETYLRCFAGDEPTHWTRFLALAEYWYNTSFHSAIGMTPFQALYGRPPPAISNLVPGHSKIVSLDELLTQKAQILQLLKINLNRARNRMVQQANLKRTDKIFEAGDWVYLKFQPYRQISLKNRVSQKLSKRFYGPFRILRRIGSVAYELELPSTARLHPVFHISLLKHCHGQPETQLSPLSLQPPPRLSQPTPLRILGLRRVPTEKGEQEELLVQWTGSDPTEATWESRSTFAKTYPQFDLEDKIFLRECGNDTVCAIPQVKGGPSSVGPMNDEGRPIRAVRRPGHLNDYV